VDLPPVAEILWVVVIARINSQVFCPF